MRMLPDTLPRVAAVLVALGIGGCGGGSGEGGGGAGVPPPVVEPPIFSTATAARVTTATPFSNGCLAVPAAETVYVNAEVEPHLAIDAANPNHLVAAWQQDRLSDGGTRGLATAVSVDGGLTWSRPQASPFSQCAGGTLARVSDPWVAVNGTSAFQIGIAFTGAALATGSRSTVLVSKSVDGGNTWGAVVTLIDDDGNRFFNDKESLTIDAVDPRYVYAVWDRLDVTERGVTMLARSQDGGITWSAPTPIYDPGAGRQTLGNVAVTTADGTVHVFYTELGPAAGNPGATEGSLNVIHSADKGVTWSMPSRVGQLLTVGTRVPEQTGLAVRDGGALGSFAANPVDGTLYAAWQDSRFTAGARDSIAISASTDGGLTWSAPLRVNSSAAVPAFTPALSVLAGGLLGVMYFDFRQAGTATFRPADVWLAVSRDGTTWREVRLAGNFDLLDAPNAGGLFLGDYHGLAGNGVSFVALYSRVNTGDTANRTDVFADRVNGDAVALSGLPGPGAAQKSAIPAWTAEAAGKVSARLAAVREKRMRKWQERRERVPE